MIRKTAKAWAYAALPGAVMALAYALLVARPMERRTLGLRHGLARHGSAADRVGRLNRAHFEQRRLEAEHLSERSVEAVSNPPVAPNTSGAGRRAQALEAISRIGERHGVTLVFTGVVEASGAQTAPETFRLAGWETPSLWRLDVRGSYAGVTALLEEVSNGGIAAIPVGLDMRSDAQSAVLRSWSIKLWM